MTLFPKMSLEQANERESMFPCRANQETFQGKHTFAHAHCFLGVANEETFVPKISQTFFVSRQQKVVAVWGGAKHGKKVRVNEGLRQRGWC